eukprot:gnl/Dysnectes_brevis/2047_a2364_3205.p1 GENE.gnl/Dysnectes_brevis/2047_a2364_3205~~gnl/Dysnectes_brevis/2047_a2364_3205.p1  ORF type:complete len:242 (+),score=60.18 gnl/Dysnectes_brevis/2047_a2364_3205:82-807(+)
MTSENTAYSFSLTTFSPSGQLRQISHALAAVSNGATSLGVKARNGVVIAAEKKMDTVLIDPSTKTFVAPISPTLGVTYSGLGPDFRALLRQGRKEADSYHRQFGEPQPVTMNVKFLSTVMQDYTQRGGVRPFGCSLLVAGLDQAGSPQLFQIDPSGAYFPWKAATNGQASSAARSFLEKRFEEQLELEDAIQVALLTLKETFDGELTEKVCSVGVIGGSYGDVFTVLTEDIIKDYLEQLDA